MMVRGRSSASSTVSMYNESASGCFLTSTILPTLRRRRDTSTGAESSADGLGCFGSSNGSSRYDSLGMEEGRSLHL